MVDFFCRESPVVNLWVHEAVAAAVCALRFLTSNVALLEASAIALAFHGPLVAHVFKIGDSRDRANVLHTNARTHLNQARVHKINPSAGFHLNPRDKRRNELVEDGNALRVANVKNLDVGVPSPSRDCAPTPNQTA